MNVAQMHPAFENPVAQSQRIFRALLKSMSEPGIASFVPESILQTHPASASVYASTWSIARALFDFDTKVFVSPQLWSENLLRSLQFQTEAKVTSTKADAMFAVLNLEELDDIEDFSLGSMESPHTSCTLLVQVASVQRGSKIVLSGPGIQGSREIFLDSLNSDHLSLIEKNHRLYPCGVDFVFCAPDGFLALPRSTRILGVDADLGDSTCM